MEELRRVQRNYGVAFANVLALAKQHGLDRPTVERLVHALSVDQTVSNNADHMEVALQRAALAFRQVVDAVRKGWRYGHCVSGGAFSPAPLAARYSLSATANEDTSAAGYRPRTAADILLGFTGGSGALPKAPERGATDLGLPTPEPLPGEHRP